MSLEEQTCITLYTSTRSTSCKALVIRYGKFCRFHLLHLTMYSHLFDDLSIESTSTTSDNNELDKSLRLKSHKCHWQSHRPRSTLSFQLILATKVTILNGHQSKLAKPMKRFIASRTLLLLGVHLRHVPLHLHKTLNSF